MWKGNRWTRLIEDVLVTICCVVGSVIWIVGVILAVLVVFAFWIGLALLAVK